jgi:KDO2-lipid IV(A) lauroyltransferase
MLLRTLKSIVEYLLFLPVNGLTRALSYRGAGRLGWALGGLIWRSGVYRRKISLENLTRAFPEKPASEIRAIAAGAYCGYARALTEMLWSGGAGEEELRGTTTLENPDVVWSALSRGRGVILLSGHFGAWEFLVTSMPLLLGCPIVAIAQPQRNRYIDATITANRSRFGSGTVTMHQSVREVMKLLRAGRIVGMLGDQSAPRESIFVEFFGRPAATHRGAAAFSLRFDTPIVMFFFVRQPDGRYRVVYEEVDRGGLSGTSEENIIELTRRHTAVLERYIRKYPDHWLWMHRRWKHTEFYESHAGAASRNESAAGRVQ